MKRIILVLLFGIYYSEANEVLDTKSNTLNLYKDYDKPKVETESDFAIYFGGHVMKTSGIDAEPLFGFDDDTNEVGSFLGYTYKLYEFHENIEFLASMEWHIVQPNNYMQMWSVGIDTRYHLNQRNSLKFKYAYTKQGGKDYAELADGYILGIGYAYKFNTNYSLFFDYQHAFMNGEYISGYRNTLNTFDYGIDMFSMGLAVNFNTSEAMTTPSLNSDGLIEYLGIRFGFGAQKTIINIDKEGEYTYSSVIAPLTLMTIPEYLNDENTLGYRYLNIGYMNFDNQKNVGKYVKDDKNIIKGSRWYIAPEIFYTNKDEKKTSFYYKATVKAGLGLLSLDTHNGENDDTQMGFYSSLGLEVGMGALAVGLEYLHENYKSNGIEYELGGLNYVVSYTVKFKDVFSQDW